MANYVPSEVVQVESKDKADGDKTTSTYISKQLSMEKTDLEIKTGKRQNILTSLT
jgi:hypothetical protein